MITNIPVSVGAIQSTINEIDRVLNYQSKISADISAIGFDNQISAFSAQTSESTNTANIDVAGIYNKLADTDAQITNSLNKYKTVLSAIEADHTINREFLHRNNQTNINALNIYLAKITNFLQEKDKFIKNHKDIIDDIHLLQKYRDLSNSAKSDMMKNDTQKLELSLKQRLNILPAEIDALNQKLPLDPNIQFKTTDNSLFYIFIVFIFIIMLAIIAIIKYKKYKQQSAIKNAQNKIIAENAQRQPIVF